MENLASGIYCGKLMHARFAPRFHRFQYQVFMAYLDLDETRTVCARSWAWSENHFAPFWIRRKDYFGDPQKPLKQCVYDEVEAQTGVRPQGPVRLLTNPRCFGVRMNPISVYYVFNTDAETLEFIVAEVTNTPWDERALYVLDYRQRAPDARVHFSKAMHVSPFMPMQQEYRWNTNLPGQGIRIHLQNLAVGSETSLEERGQERKCFEALLNLQREECTSRTLASLVWRFPWMTMKVVWGIYWQAFRLWRKGAHFYSNPEAPDQAFEKQKP